MSERANRKSDGFGARLLPKAHARQSTASAPTVNNMTVVDTDGDGITPDVVASSITHKETTVKTTEKRTKKQSASNAQAEKQRGRDLLLQRRSLLAHAPPDIGRTIRKKSLAAEDAHEFQKVKLRHVDVDLSPKQKALEHINYHDALTNHVSVSTASMLQSLESERSEFLHVSFEANCQAERATKDVVVAMTPAPIQTPRTPSEERAKSPPRHAQQLANVSHEKTVAATQSATATATATASAAAKKDKLKKKTAPPPRPQSKPEEAKSASSAREKHDRPLKGFSAPTRAWLLHVGDVPPPQPQSEEAAPQQQESQQQQHGKPQKQQKSQIGKHDDAPNKKRTQDGAAKKDISAKDEKPKSADSKQVKASLAEKRRSESQSRAARKISSEKPAPQPVVAPKATAAATAAARRRTPPATRPKPVVAPEELDRRRMQNELVPGQQQQQQQGEKKDIKTAPKPRPIPAAPAVNGRAADGGPKPKPKDARHASLPRSADVNSGVGGPTGPTEPSKATVVVRLHPGQARKVSKCSATSVQDDDLQSTTYLAEIHRLDCDSAPCCAAAAGLEITFEAAPQSIDIRLISDAESGGANVVVNGGTSHVDNKTRQ